MSVGTQSETGQGSGTVAKVSAEAGIAGSSHFEQASFHGGVSHWRERGFSFERRIIALQGGVDHDAPIISWATGAV